VSVVIRELKWTHVVMQIVTHFVCNTVITERAGVAKPRLHAIVNVKASKEVLMIGSYMPIRKTEESFYVFFLPIYSAKLRSC